MNLPLKGGCLCGRIRFEVDAEPLTSGVCHCRHCQLATGAPHFAAVAVPTPALRVQGETRDFAVSGDSGSRVERSFCPTCGTTLFGRSASMPQATQVSAVVFDDPSGLAPRMHIYAASAQPWDAIGGPLPAFPRMPQA
jgi:hypothetical protein